MDSEPVSLEVYNWWEETRETDAFATVKRIHERRHPNIHIENVADPDSRTRTNLANRMLAGAPPATFQANIGADLLRWTRVESEPSAPGAEPATECKLRRLDALYEELDLAGSLPPALLARLRVPNADGYYAIPINIHRLNVLYYNKRLHDEHVASGRSSYLDLEQLCPLEPLAAEPLDVMVAMGSSSEFALVLLVFENLLPAITSGEYYEALFRGEAEAPVRGEGGWATPVRRALECLIRLSDEFVGDYTRMSWADAAELVADDQAAFTVMGDWVDGQLRGTPGEASVASMPFPGTEGLFVFTSDTFPLPAGTPHLADAEDLLRTVGSENAQLAFSRMKGSIPALEIDPAKLDPAARAKRQAFDESRQLLATSGFFPPYYPVGELGRRLERMLTAERPADMIGDVIAFFGDAYPLLGRWQTRLPGAAPPNCP